MLDIGDRGAVLSEDGLYRYRLWRTWGPQPPALFLMLNPSTADADVDDQTIRKCIGFARREGCGGLLVWNLYAFRATDPDELDRVEDPIGRGNEDHLWPMLDEAGLIIAAWGSKPNRGKYRNREMMIRVGPLYDRQVWALKLTKDGHPNHPLYLPGNSPLVPYA